jgi:hypothetical protein
MRVKYSLACCNQHVRHFAAGNLTYFVDGTIYLVEFALELYSDPRQLYSVIMVSDWPSRYVLGEGGVGRCAVCRESEAGRLCVCGASIAAKRHATRSWGCFSQRRNFRGCRGTGAKVHGILAIYSLTT